MEEEWTVRPSDAQCHRCGKVFTYRKDREKHQREVHSITPNKPVANDKPSWDTDPESDAWHNSWRPRDAGTESMQNDWAEAPTPAEAARGLNTKARVAVRSTADKATSRPRPNLRVILNPPNKPEHSTLDKAPSSMPPPLDGLRLHTLPKLHDTSSSASSNAKSVWSKSSLSSAERDPQHDATLTSTTPEWRKRGSMRPQVLATTGAGDSSDEEEEEEEEAVATRDKKSRLTSVGDHPNDRYRSLKCLVCRYEASSAPDLQQHFRFTDHKNCCRVCYAKFRSGADLKKHVYSTDHHHPITARGRQMDKSRSHPKRSNLTELSIYEDGSDSGHRETEEQPTSPAGTESSESSPTRDVPLDGQAASPNAGDPLESEEDLIDLEWTPPPEKSPLQRSPSPPAKPPSPPVQIPGSSDCVGDYSLNTKRHSLNASAMEFQPSSMGFPTGQRQSPSPYDSFYPTQLLVAPPATASHSHTDMPTSPSLNAQPTSTTASQTEHCSTPSTIAPSIQRRSVDPTSQTTSTSPSSPPPSVPVSHPCPAGCSSAFPSATASIVHLETGICAHVPTGASALYSVAAESSHAHSFIFGRYMLDMVAQRDLKQRYRGNAWPFICPNEAQCGGVYRQMAELVRHWEKGSCVEGAWVASVVEEIGAKLAARAT